MPPELQELGDKYVKEEFKRHKDAEAPFVVVFMKEWAVSGVSCHFWQLCTNIIIIMIWYDHVGVDIVRDFDKM